MVSLDGILKSVTLIRILMQQIVTQTNPTQIVIKTCDTSGGLYFLFSLFCWLG